MPLGLVGRKLGMTRLFDERGVVRPVTVIQAGPGLVVRHRTPEVDGYTAVQVAFEPVRPERISKPMRGVYQALGVDPHRILTEFRLEEGEELPEIGTRLTVELFRPGGKVHVRGRTKGRGFAGVIKRHRFGGGRDSHGSNFHRAPGSIGMATHPGHVLKGKRMPGQMGNKYRTIRGLTVLEVVPEENLVVVVGGVPGAKGSWVRLTDAGQPD